MDHTDRQYMLEALELARLGWGMTSPNPMVGAVIVRNGNIIGRGYHRRAGTAHAEINALNDCSETPSGATLYVTLEPCSTFGRTPPCTDAIIRAGVSRVVVGCLDPNPKHAGRGMDILRQNGIVVLDGVEEPACRRLNEAFFRWITTGIPFVTLKMAMTLDGRIATRDGDSQWITGPEARTEVQRLRRGADAIMVGGETVRRDRPSLNVRDPEGWARQPRRLVVSHRMTLEEATGLLQPGCAPEVLAPVDSKDWEDELLRLGSEGVTSLLIEGGGELAGTVLQAGIVDKVVFFIAPKLLCGRDSRPVIGGANPVRLNEALPLNDMTITKIGDDFCCTGYLCRVCGSTPKEI